MRKFKIMPLILSSLLLFTSCAETSKTTYVESPTHEVETVHSLSFDAIGGKDVMPIGVWWGPYDWDFGSSDGNLVPYYHQDKFYQLLRDCDVNMITVSRDNYVSEVKREPIMKSLDFCKKYKMGLIVQDSAVYTTTWTNKNALLERISAYISHPACIGIHAIDEPKQSAFAKVKEAYDAFNSLGFNDRVLSTNLYGNCMTPIGYSGNESKGITYEEYISTFLEEIDIKFLSTDTYIFNEPESEGKPSQVNSKTLYDDLSTKRKYSDMHEIPFWVMIQAGDPMWFPGEYVIQTLYPSESELIWNVNVSVAYGAKGLTYFTAFQPDGSSFLPGGERVFNRTGMFGLAGNINRWYYYAQKVNKQLAATDYILMNAMNLGVIPIGKAKEEITGEEKIDTFRELKAVSASGGEALVGCFDHFGKTVLYVVNNSTLEKQEITLNFDNNYGYEIIQRAEHVDVSGESIKLTVEAGEGILVRLK